MLTVEQKDEIKAEFLGLINSLTIEGADIQGLINYLETNGFFESPASTQYHCSFPGGLCLHSLNVYNTLKDLDVEHKYSNDDLVIVSLFHELNKIDFYETFVQNKKVYSENGSKYDSMGKYDWISSESYKVRDASERGTYGTFGFNSYMILSRFIPMSEEVMVALVNYDCDSDNKDINTIMSKTPLLVLLHCADLISTYVIEK